MEIQLKNNYTLFVSCKLCEEQPAGIYLKREKGFLYPVEMEEDEMKVIQYFPRVYEEIKKGKTLQLYDNLLKVHASIGDIIGEGPYGETKCFEVMAETQEENCFLSLIQLEKEIKQNDNTTKLLRKAYKEGSKCYYE